MIIPFKIDGSVLRGKLRYDLTGINWIDATVPEYDERIAELARSIGVEIGMKAEICVEGSSPVLRNSQIVYSDLFYGRTELIRQIHETYQSGARTVF